MLSKYIFQSFKNFKSTLYALVALLLVKDWIVLLLLQCTLVFAQLIRLLLCHTLIIDIGAVYFFILCSTSPPLVRYCCCDTCNVMWVYGLTSNMSTVMLAILYVQVSLVHHIY